MSHKYSNFLMVLCTINNISNSVAVSVQGFQIMQDFLLTNMRQRFSVDKVISSQLINFVRFDVSRALISEPFTGLLVLTRTYLTCHWSLRKWQRVATNYKTTARKCLTGSQEYTNVLIVLARILAAMPHSADVERCISANNY